MLVSRKEVYIQHTILLPNTKTFFYIITKSALSSLQSVLVNTISINSLIAYNNLWRSGSHRKAAPQFLRANLHLIYTNIIFGTHSRVLPKRNLNVMNTEALPCRFCVPYCFLERILHTWIGAWTHSSVHS